MAQAVHTSPGLQFKSSPGQTSLGGGALLKSFTLAEDPAAKVKACFDGCSAAPGGVRLGGFSPVCSGQVVHTTEKTTTCDTDWIPQERGKELSGHET